MKYRQFGAILGLVAMLSACGGEGGSLASGGVVVAQSETGRDPPEIQKLGDFRHLRMRSLDQRGVFSREILYLYGKVELGAPKRP